MNFRFARTRVVSVCVRKTMHTKFWLDIKKCVDKFTARIGSVVYLVIRFFFLLTIIDSSFYLVPHNWLYFLFDISILILHR